MSSASTNVIALHAAGVVGTWNTDVAAGLSLLDEGAAALLAGDRDLARIPIPLEVAFDRIHPDDKDWVFAWVRRVRQTGGPIAAEFRILTVTGEVRWILNRGCLTPDANGVMRGHGTYIDTTDTRPTVTLASLSAASTDEDPLHRAADCCIQAHAAIQRSGDTYLALLMNTLLLAIGRVIARKSAL